MAFLVFEGFQPIDIAGPWQAFATANDELGHVRYQLLTCAASGLATTRDGGFRLQAGQTLAQSRTLQAHTVIVPGGEGIHQICSDLETIAWLRAHDVRSQRTCSVCTGAFLLAAAGLLDGQRVTTHWRSAQRLQQRYPALQVTDELLFCESGKYWTTAGVSAGIDLALTLIERDCGAHLAQKVARRLVLYLRRGGDQRQYSQTLRAQDRANAPFADLIEQLQARLGHPWSVDEMAEICLMSRRSFQRKFKETFGVSPLGVLKNLRAERHETLAASGGMSRKQIRRVVAA